MKLRYSKGGVITVLLGVALVVLAICMLTVRHSGAKGMVLGDATTAADIVRPNLPKQLVTNDNAPEPYAGAAVVIDATTGSIVVGTNEHQSLPIASTTKIMSSIVALSSIKNLNESVTVSDEAANQIGSVMGLSSGETLSANDLLTGALLVSGNDAIYALAEHTGSVESFVRSMNETAAMLDLHATHFNDPAGLDDTGHSSAFDLATMFRYALTFSEFRRIIAIPDTTVVSEQGISHHLQNSNRLIQSDQPLYLAEVLGGKTGFTPDAGHTLVAAASSNGHTYVAAVLHTTEESNDASAREVNRLFEWTFAHASFR